MNDSAGEDHRGVLATLDSSRTAPLAIGGYACFAGGFFVLASAGTAYPAATYALIAAGALLVALPLLMLACAVAASETLTRRAWATGFRSLEEAERTAAASLARGLRYAGVLWLANGAALWAAALLTQL